MLATVALLFFLAVLFVHPGPQRYPTGESGSAADAKTPFNTETLRIYRPTVQSESTNVTSRFPQFIHAKAQRVRLLVAHAQTEVCFSPTRETALLIVTFNHAKGEILGRINDPTRRRSLPAVTRDRLIPLNRGPEESVEFRQRKRCGEHHKREEDPFLQSVFHWQPINSGRRHETQCPADKQDFSTFAVPTGPQLLYRSRAAQCCRSPIESSHKTERALADERILYVTSRKLRA